MNMLSVIVPKSDQINADDLIGTTKVITVREVKFHPGTEQPVSMYFEGSDKAYRPGKSMCRVLVAAWGPDANVYVGRSMKLYRDATVRFGKDEVGGIRISHLSHIDAPMRMALTATRGSRKAYQVQPLEVEQQRPTADSLTIDAARKLVEQAGDLDALRTVWSRKTMAPFRADLQATLDARKAALSSEGPDDTQRGEAHTGDAAELIRMFEAADTREAYDSAKKAYEVMIGGLSDAEATDVETARDAAADRVMG